MLFTCFKFGNPKGVDVWTFNGYLREVDLVGIKKILYEIKIKVVTF